MPQAILEIEKLLQRHVQKAIELAQHLFGFFSLRGPFGRQIDEDTALIGGLPSPGNKTLALEPLEHWRKRAKIHSQQCSEFSDAERTVLPKHHENEVLRVSHAQLLQERHEQTRHVIAGGIKREAKMIIEPGHLHRRHRSITHFFL